jgi:Rad3-related DNA helicase
VKRLEIRCLDPAPLSSSVLDPQMQDGVRSSVLMSGTLVPGDFYKDILGIPSAAHREFPNVFPRRNRLLLLDDSISLDWRSREERMYGRISERMAAIRTNTPGGCMFFFPSYEVMRNVLEVHGHRDLLVEERASTKGDEVQSHLEAGGSVAAVMGASLSEGLDLPGLIKATAVFGLPLERISDNVKLGMSYYETMYPGRGRDYFYYLPAVTKIVQSIGRAHRRKEDKAGLYVFDRRFCRNYLDAAPSWWAEEAVKVRDLGSLIGKVREFWKVDQDLADSDFSGADNSIGGM